LFGAVRTKYRVITTASTAIRRSVRAVKRLLERLEWKRYAAS
jgi:hypothetical protein